MAIDRRNLMISAGLLSAGLASAASARTPPPEDGVPADRRIAVPGTPGPAEVIELWPGVAEAPGRAPGLLNLQLEEVTVEEGTPGQFHYRAVHGVSRPRLSVFPATNPNGAALVIAPGGGYRRIAFDIEGYELARYFTARGLTVFVLLYRLPAEGWADAADVPLADAQRAMRLVRAHAARFGLDPARTAFMGFSAGGHVCASLATRHAAQVYAPVDDADVFSARPLLAAPIYPVISTDPAIAHMGSRTNLIGEHPSAEQLRLYSPNRNVTADTPPCFLTHAEDDATVPVENTVVLRAALKAAGIPVETHLFPEGGHGFGLRKVEGKPAHAWADLFLAFARQHGLFA